jgi:NitT/TauT family transport system substrate-binding protein
MHHRGTRFAVALLAIVLMAGACGSSSKKSASSNGATTTSAASTNAKGVTGCESGYTDPSDTSPTRKVARCSAGNPAPKPLAQMTTINLSSSFRLEFMSPILVSDLLGELQKENLKLNFVTLSFADAVPQLAQGRLDAAVGGIEGALFNAGNQGLPVKMTLGNYFPKDAGNYDVPQTGLWCRRDAFKDQKSPDWTQVAHVRIASAVGKATTSAYYVGEMLKRRSGKDIDLSTASWQQIPSADQVLALKNKAVDCAILLDPLWASIKDDPNYVMAATQTPGEPLGGIFYGKSLLVDHPEVGVAFARAYIRTVNTYFNGDYHQNQQTVDALAKALNQPAANITKNPPLLFDWEIRKGTTDKIQTMFIHFGGILQFSTPVAEDKIIDRSFYAKATGFA